MIELMEQFILRFGHYGAAGVGIAFCLITLGGMASAVVIRRFQKASLLWIPFCFVLLSVLWAILMTKAEHNLIQRATSWHTSYSLWAFQDVCEKIGTRRYYINGSFVGVRELPAIKCKVI